MRGGVVTVAADKLSDFLAAEQLCLDDHGVPVRPLVFVEISPGGSRRLLGAAGRAARTVNAVLVGVAPEGLDEPALGLATELACTLTTRTTVPEAAVSVADLDAALAAVESTVRVNPRASISLIRLLRLTAIAPVDLGLVAESSTYSMLLAGAEFARWRAARPRRTIPDLRDPAVLVDRHGERLDVTINRPERHNSFSRPVRDGLCQALDLAAADPTIEHVVLRGEGPSFCSGGDLDEFGPTTDVTTAHLVRIERSVAARLHHVRHRATVVVHGACIGAGVEIPSFADEILALDGVFFQLPELAMGLVPGAGGTVGITRRVGRWKTAYLALSGTAVDVTTALDWGLVDELIDDRAGDRAAKDG